jgi:hypothetical protein
MSCFSTVTIDPAWLPQELQNISTWQTKDLPEDEEKRFPNDNYYDGAVRRDGAFVREDGMWNPSLVGWAELVSDLCYAPHEICIRFECGVLAELIVGDEPPGERARSVRGWIQREQ